MRAAQKQLQAAEKQKKQEEAEAAKLAQMSAKEKEKYLKQQKVKAMFNRETEK